jgi:hypothetical protein
VYDSVQDIRITDVFFIVAPVSAFGGSPDMTKADLNQDQFQSKFGIVCDTYF